MRNFRLCVSSLSINSLNRIQCEVSKFMAVFLTEQFNYSSSCLLQYIYNPGVDYKWFSCHSSLLQFIENFPSYETIGF